jgi:hypothetical protein
MPLSQDTQDILIGVAILVPFLFAIYLAGKVLYKFKAARFIKAWAPLVPVIDGKVTNDGGGAATSWLSGIYQGNTVQASMVPNRNRYTGQTGHRYNYFEVELQNVAGQHDWDIVYRAAVLGFGDTGWHIETADKTLEQCLQNAGVDTRAAALKPIRIAYKSRQSTLTLSEEVTPRWAPTPERFREEIEFLIGLVQINEQLNPAVTSPS